MSNGNNDTHGLNQRMGKWLFVLWLYSSCVLTPFHSAVADMSMNNNNNNNYNSGGGNNGGGYQKAAYIPPHLRGRAYGQDGGSNNGGNTSGWDKPAPRPG